ncbi:NAD-dependent epimerase/dehydratase family protein [Rhabdochlamydiaceae symbiont of Dictyostelium giganteum]|uniref:NAD-dependent epimerase/dehydratase family protein n=1 Tax=Rhabdochlamydiaceae symbiont of Dictyostelium giganteum TaxID=3342349 RepID=UPI00384F685A
MNILITGVAGFIGFHLARRLVQEGHHVTGIDHLQASHALALKRSRLKLLQDEKIRFIQGDIHDFALLEKIVLEESISHCIHLAAEAGVRYSQIYPQSAVDTNISGFIPILELIRKYPHIPLIYASSSSVYGLNTKVPFAEDDILSSPAHLYGVTKQANELMASTYHHLYNIKTAGLRFFTVYGPWGRPDMAYYFFTEKILKEEPITLYGEGLLKRDFTYIDDIIQGIVAVLEQEFSCDIFNLGNHQPETVLTLVNLLEKKLKKKSVIHFKKEALGEVPVTYADLTKSQQILNYFPQTSLSEGLDHFVKWYLHYRG